MSYPIHTTENAPAASQPILQGAKKALGFVPNLYGLMAGAPALLKAYTTLSQIFDESSFSPAERQVVLLEVSSQNECTYCVAAHSVIAGMQKVPTDVVEAIRQGAPISDKKLEALRRYTASIVETRGWPSAETTRDFLAAGYTQAQALEVVLGVGMKTLSNYANHIGQTPLDAAFTKAAWAKAS